MSTSRRLHCRVCGTLSPFVFSQRVLGHEAGYFDCPTCSYLQTETPHWLEQAYSQAINDVDTGILQRNRLNVGRVIMTLLILGRLQGRVIDYAGGYGILVRALRDAGVDAYWQDKYCENLLARGFEATDPQCDLLTAFEVFEHLVNPLDDLSAMLDASDTVLVSTELVASSKAPAPDWWYYGPEHGQHIGFFRRSTLRWMAVKLGVHVQTDGSAVHLFSRRPIPSYWTAAVRRGRLWPVVARLRLRSRTMTDFATLREQRR